MFIPEPQTKGYYITLAGTCFNCGEKSSLDFRGVNPFTIEGWISRPSRLRAAATVFSKPGELIFGLTASAHVFAQRFPSKEILGPRRSPA